MSEFELKLIAIFFSAFMLFQAVAIWRVVGTFLFPAAIFSLVWFFYTVIPLVLLFEVPINPVSIAYISLCSLMFTLGSLPFDWKKAFIMNKNKDASFLRHFKSSIIYFSLFSSSIFAILLSAMSMARNGVDLQFLISNLSETSGSYAAQRGHEKLEYGTIEILSYLFTNITPVFGGFLYDIKHKVIKNLIILIVSFSPAIIYMSTQSTKIIILTSILLYLGGILLVKIYNNDFKLFKKTSIIKGLIGISILVPFISFSLMSRQLFSNFNTTEEMLENLRYGLNSYLLGQTYAFSDFFTYYLGQNASQSYKNDYNSYGYFTFKALFDSLGGTKYFPPTYYEEGYFYGTTLGTNIFTIFRSLIYDFGWVGSLVFFLCCSVFVHYFFHRLLSHRKSWVSCAVFIVFISFIFMSYLFSIFTSRYMMLIGIVIWIILFINDRICVKINPIRSKPLS
jgi:oligosaccharide repeat unit polymerase